MLPVLSYLTCFPLLFFPRISVQQSNSNYSKAKLAETKVKKDCPSSLVLCVSGFSLAGMLHIFPQEPRTSEHRRFPETRGKRFLLSYSRLISSLRESGVASPMWKYMAFPFLFQRFPLCQPQTQPTQVPVLHGVSHFEPPEGTQRASHRKKLRIGLWPQL